MIEISGRELAAGIKDKQAKTAHRLRESFGVQPKLVILQAKDDPAINTYVGLKQRYGQDIGVDVEIVRAAQAELTDKIRGYNHDPKVHGMIVQLPIPDPAELGAVLNSVRPAADVDGLGAHSEFDSASATAILWLLAGHNIDLAGKKIVVVGRGRLVGSPLTRLLTAAGHNVLSCDQSTKGLLYKVKQADILISATGSPGLIKADWIKPGAVVVDAGTSSEAGEIRGDLENSVYERDDISVTPKKGGVGPLTVCALFANVLQAAQKQTS